MICCVSPCNTQNDVSAREVFFILCGKLFITECELPFLFFYIRDERWTISPSSRLAARTYDWRHITSKLFPRWTFHSTGCRRLCACECVYVCVRYVAKDVDVCACVCVHCFSSLIINAADRLCSHSVRGVSRSSKHASEAHLGTSTDFE